MANWVDELFDRCSEILKIKELSDSEKIGYVLAVSQEEASVPSHLPLVDKLYVIRHKYHETFDDSGA